MVNFTEADGILNEYSIRKLKLETVCHQKSSCVKQIFKLKHVRGTTTYKSKGVQKGKLLRTLFSELEQVMFLLGLKRRTLHVFVGKKIGDAQPPNSILSAIVLLKGDCVHLHFKIAAFVYTFRQPAV